MIKPRIVIADVDYDYIIRLQQKFITEFLDKIELEVVTDCDYFQELFSVHQKIDVLLVGQIMYDTLLVKKHNVANVFLLSEKEDCDSEDISASVIYKYSSIKEIYNEIIGSSRCFMSFATESIKNPEIICVTSAKGGIGKTTIAMGLSACLSKSHKRVLFIDAQDIQAFQYYLSNNSKITGSEIYSELLKTDGRNYLALKHMIRSELFSYVPPFKAALSSLGLNKHLYSKLAMEAKKSGDYDYVIIDTDNVFDNTKAQLLSIADRVIFITKQDDISVEITNNYLSNINGINKDKYLFVCNDFVDEKDNALISFGKDTLFSVSEYIRHLDDKDMTKEKMYENKDFQKIAYLFM